ncbi:MAG: hypothetical protein OIF55_15245, partial [Amphritea sp.]|nr:hypothetical protein [Amphritea sp.]
QLWLTLKAIEQQNWTITMPEAARDLIESVYSDEAQNNYPEALQDASLDAEGAQQAERGQARMNSLLLEKGYCRGSASNTAWNADTKTPTRLSDETITVVLMSIDDGALTPWAGAVEHRWSLSQINLREKDWHSVHKRIPAEYGDVIAQLKEHEPALRWVEVLPLVGELENCYSAEGGWNLN